MCIQNTFQYSKLCNEFHLIRVCQIMPFETGIYILGILAVFRGYVLDSLQCFSDFYWTFLSFLIRHGLLIMFVTHREKCNDLFETGLGLSWLNVFEDNVHFWNFTSFFLYLVQSDAGFAKFVNGFFSLTAPWLPK